MSGNSTALARKSQFGFFVSVYSELSVVKDHDLHVTEQSKYSQENVRQL